MMPGIVNAGLGVFSFPSTYPVSVKYSEPGISTARKYQDAFSRTDDDIGRTERVTHMINTGNAIPIRQRSRRMPIGKQEIEKGEVKRMLNQGIIEPSRSPWASNIVLVIKKDGRPRFCVDYRMLNDVTKKDAYPLPRVDECLDALAGAKWLDLCLIGMAFPVLIM
jgi:hypothetical protein